MEERLTAAFERGCGRTGDRRGTSGGLVGRMGAFPELVAWSSFRNGIVVDGKEIF